MKREQESFEVKSPAAGDTIALAESRFDELSLNISWTAPQATKDRPTSISLVQGNNLSSLALLNVINGTQPPLIINASLPSLLIVSRSKYTQQRIIHLVCGRSRRGARSRFSRQLALRLQLLYRGQDMVGRVLFRVLHNRES